MKLNSPVRARRVSHGHSRHQDCPAAAINCKRRTLTIQWSWNVMKTFPLWSALEKVFHVKSGIKCVFFFSYLHFSGDVLIWNFAVQTILYKASRHGNICSKDVKLHLNTCCLFINANNIQNTLIYRSYPFRKWWALQLKEKRAAISAPLSASGAVRWRSSFALLRADGGQQECLETEKLSSTIAACAGTTWLSVPSERKCSKTI